MNILQGLFNAIMDRFSKKDCLEPPEVACLFSKSNPELVKIVYDIVRLQEKAFNNSQCGIRDKIISERELIYHTTSLKKGNDLFEVLVRVTFLSIHVSVLFKKNYDANNGLCDSMIDAQYQLNSSGLTTYSFISDDLKDELEFENICDDKPQEHEHAVLMIRNLYNFVKQKL